MTRYSEADRDTGGRTYDPAELALWQNPRWLWRDGEVGALAKAQCSLEMARDDLTAALGDFEATGTRPLWVKRTRKLLAEVEKLRAAVDAELNA